MTFYHPKYYAALRAERKKLQAASDKLQATSNKGPERQAPSSKPQANRNQNLVRVQVLKSLKQQAPSFKLQATSVEAASFKLQDHESWKKFQAPLTEVPG